MPNTTISQLPSAASAEPNAVVAADNALGTATQKVTLAQIKAMGPAAHAATHASVGIDPISPSDIGAANLSHASQHMTGGPDEISPASIGAANASHSHSEATSSVAGFLSASDKVRIDSLNAATYGVGSQTLSTNTDNLAPGSQPITRLNVTAAVSLSGVVAGVSGQFRYLYNAGSSTVTLLHNSTSSSAGNRFLVYTNANLPVTPGTSVTLLYDATSQAWRVF